MSMHKSFATKGGIVGHRNVLTRAERLARMRQEGRWPEGRSVFHLPKVRSIKPKKRAKAAKKAEAGAEGEAAAPVVSQEAGTSEAAKAKGTDTKVPEKK